MERYSYAEQLRLAHLITEPAIRKAIAALHLPFGSRGLDVGCGTGHVTLELAEAVGREGTVVGVDTSEEHLALARGLASATTEDAEVVDTRAQTDFVPGDLRKLSFGNAVFDWLWCADTFWPYFVVEDPIVTLPQLTRVVKPGGTVALLYWSGQQLLPGHPQLEARLNQAFTAASPYLSTPLPEHQFMDALRWFAAAGCVDTAARTFVANVQGPLSPEIREAVACCCHMLWEPLDATLSAADRREWRRLCSADSPESLTASPSYYGFVTYTLFSGTRMTSA